MSEGNLGGWGDAGVDGSRGHVEVSWEYNIDLSLGSNSDPRSQIVPLRPT